MCESRLVIKSFKCRETERIYNQIQSKKLPHQIQRLALRKLQVLDYATDINDLRIPPSNHLEMLRGNRKGQRSIRINKQWRICFQWKQGHAYDVEITDYHA